MITDGIDGKDKNPDKRWNYKEMLDKGAVIYDENLKVTDFENLPVTDDLDTDSSDPDPDLKVTEEDVDSTEKRGKQTLKDLLLPDEKGGYNDIQKDSAFQPNQLMVGCDVSILN